MKLLPRRRRVFVDRQLQGGLCIRVALYWFCCLMSVGLTLGAWSALENGPLAIDKWSETLWNQFGPVLVVSTIILPFALLDCLIMSNKYAGPLYRIRLALKQLATDEPMRPLKLRKGDLLVDIADDINLVSARLESLDAQIAAESNNMEAAANVVVAIPETPTPMNAPQPH